MYARLLNPLKHFNIQTFPHANQPVSKEVSLKEGLLRLSGQQTLPGRFKQKIKNFKKHLQKRGYPESFIQNTFSEVSFEDRKKSPPTKTQRK